MVPFAKFENRGSFVVRFGKVPFPLQIGLILQVGICVYLRVHAAASFFFNSGTLSDHSLGTSEWLKKWRFRLEAGKKCESAGNRTPINWKACNYATMQLC